MRLVSARVCALPVAADAAAHHAALRELGPVFRDDRLGAWVVTGGVAAEAVLRDHERFSSAEGVGIERLAGARRRGMVMTDPPLHTRLRRVVHRAFTPRDVARFRDTAARTAQARIGMALAGGELEVVEQLAKPVPIAVLADILGLDACRFSDLLPHAEVIARNFDTPADDRARVRDAFSALDEYVADALAGRIQLRRGVMTMLLSATRKGGLGVRELKDACATLVLAGTHTTVNLIANAIHALLEHPAVARRLWDDPTLAAAVVEEALRWEPPIQAVFRTVRETAWIGTQPVEQGSRVCVVIGTANRDPSRHPEPDAFDIDRGSSRALAFGVGIHHCLGASLARMEAKATLEALVSATATIAPGRGRPVRAAGLLQRGFEVLPVRVEPRD